MILRGANHPLSRQTGACRLAPAGGSYDPPFFLLLVSLRAIFACRPDRPMQVGVYASLLCDPGYKMLALKILFALRSGGRP